MKRAQRMMQAGAALIEANQKRKTTNDRAILTADQASEQRQQQEVARESSLAEVKAQIMLMQEEKRVFQEQQRQQHQRDLDMLAKQQSARDALMREIFAEKRIQESENSRLSDLANQRLAESQRHDEEERSKLKVPVAATIPEEDGDFDFLQRDAFPDDMDNEEVGSQALKENRSEEEEDDNKERRPSAPILSDESSDEEFDDENDEGSDEESDKESDLELVDDEAPPDPADNLLFDDDIEFEPEDLQDDDDALPIQPPPVVHRPVVPPPADRNAADVVHNAALPSSGLQGVAQFVHGAFVSCIASMTVIMQQYFYNFPAFISFIFMMWFVSFQPSYASSDAICSIISIILSLFGLPFPRTVNKLISGSSLKYHVNDIPFKVLCPKCKTPYLLSDCLMPDPNHPGEMLSKKCKVKYFEHIGPSNKNTFCGQILLPLVRNSAGKYVPRPHSSQKMMYPGNYIHNFSYLKINYIHEIICLFLSHCLFLGFFLLGTCPITSDMHWFVLNHTGLKPQIERILQRDDIQSCLNHSVDRKQHIPPGVLADVYDGQVWKEWEARPKIEGKPTKWFAADSWDIGLQLNADGFQPFEGSNYSVTAVFVTILNLPLEIRHNIENVILVALLPGVNFFRVLCSDGFSYLFCYTRYFVFFF